MAVSAAVRSIDVCRGQLSRRPSTPIETCSLKACYDGDTPTSFDVPPNLKEGALGGPFEVGQFMVDHCPSQGYGLTRSRSRASLLDA